MRTSLGKLKKLTEQEKIVKLAAIWVRWNNPLLSPRLNGDDAMYEIGDLFKSECLLAWNMFVKAEDKRRAFALKIRHEMVRGVSEGEMTEAK